MGLIVVGTVAYDSITTPFGKHERVLGGSATYFSLSASRFTMVRLCAAVGEDFDEKERATLQVQNIDTSGLQVIPGGKTFFWVGEYEGDMNAAITKETHLNVLATFKPKVPAAHRDTPFVFLANIDPELQQEVVEQMTGPKLVACDTMNFWISSKPKELEKTLTLVDMIVINDGEAQMLTGKDNLVKAARELHKIGPKYIFIKRGEYGSLLSTPEGFFWAPAYPLERVQDPTGAGDTFAGGVMGYLASTGEVSEASLRMASYYGSVMASFTVEEFSVTGLTSLSREQIDERVLEFRKLTSLSGKVE
jgi:sugar/nucleoside kinase (ribokinase family)